MIKVSFQPENLEGKLEKKWKRLKEKCLKETEELISIWEQEGHITNDVLSPGKFRDMRDFLSEHVFMDKCGYCGAPLKPSDGKRTECEDLGLPEYLWNSDTNSVAEHYRPKLDVEHEHDAAATGENSERIDHPGYFWLTYYWKNIIPSCRKCNKEKGIKFPIRAGEDIYALPQSCIDRGDLREPPMHVLSDNMLLLHPDDLDKREKPSIFSPYKDDPENHFNFGVRGRVFPKSEKGKSTYNMLKFDRLQFGLAKSQEVVKSLFLSKLSNEFQDTDKNVSAAIDSVFKKLKSIIDDGYVSYPSALLSYLSRYSRKLKWVLKEGEIARAELYELPPSLGNLLQIKKQMTEGSDD